MSNLIDTDKKANIETAPVKRAGRPSVFHASLGKGKPDSFNYPVPINGLMKEEEFKILMNRMVMEPDFKADILARVKKKVRKKKEAN